ncbi:MAG: hypothetical protein K6C12_03255 [Oscillospiraceae bacterium]|nr:hypothetical protein [Oscillospiraceae bacterium]
MAVVKNLMVRAGADFSAITKQAKKASSSMQSMRSSVTSACDGMRKAAAGLKSAFAAIGIGLSAAAVVSFAKDAAAAYDEQAESQVKLARVMRNTMGASNDQIQSILDLADAQQELGVVAGDVQIAGAQELATYLTMSDSLQTLIPVMNDMAAQQYGYNVTAEQTTTIATMLGKVMNGQVGALSRYGYTFDEAQEKILKYGTEAQRAAVLAEVVEQSVGGMNAALAATPTGRMKQLSNTLGDIKAQFGQAVRTLGTVFLPVLNTVAKVLAAIATLANKVAQTIANVFGGKAAGKEWKYLPQGSAATVSETSDAVDSLTDAEKKSGKAAKEARKEQEKLQNMSFDTLEILADHSSSASDSGGGGDDTDVSVPDIPLDTSPLIQETAVAEEAGEGLSKLQEILEKLKAAWESFRSKLDLSKISAAFDKVKESAGRLFNSLKKVGEFLWTRILEPLAVWTVNDALPAFLDVLSGVLDVLSAAIDAAMPGLEWLWDNFLEPAAKWVGDAFIDAMERLADNLERLAKVLRGEMSFSEFIEQLNLLEASLLGIGIGVALAGITTAITTFGGKLSLFVAKLAGTPAQITLAGEGIAASLATAAQGIAISALAVVDALLIVYDVKLWKQNQEALEDLQETHTRETETALSNYQHLYETKGKEVADQWAAMVYQIDTTGMTLDESQKAIAEKVESYWDDVPQNMWEGLKSGLDSYFGEGGTGLFGLLEDAFTGAVTGIKDLLGIHSPSTVFEDMGKNMVEGLEKGFDRKWREFFSSIKESWSSLKSWWSNLTLPSFHIKLPHISISGRFSINPPSVPHFHVSWYAKGGIVDAATLFGGGRNLIGVGEAGKEAIVPLERNMEWVTRVAEQIRREAFPTVAAGGLDGDLSAMADALYQAVFDASKDAGGSSDGVKVAEWKVGTKVLARAIFQDMKEIAREKGISMIDNFA